MEETVSQGSGVVSFDAQTSSMAIGAVTAPDTVVEKERPHYVCCYPSPSAHTGQAPPSDSLFRGVHTRYGPAVLDFGVGIIRKDIPPSSITMQCHMQSQGHR